MKKALFILTLALCMVFSDRAQAQRYLPGQRGIQLTTGTINGSGFHVGAALSTYTKKANRWTFGGEYLEKRYAYKDLSLPLAQFTAEGGHYFKFLSDGSKTIFFSLGVSGMAGYETINWNEKLLPDGATIQSSDAFIFGGALSLEMETYLTDGIVLLLNVRERILGGSSVGKFTTQLGFGLKFIIN